MTQLYKVLDAQGRSQNGGSLQWSLPTADAPGEWHAAHREPVCCQSGLHLTDDPAVWFKPGSLVYLAEGDGASHTDGADKTAFARARLIRLCTRDDLAALGIYSEGIHETKRATVHAYDSATVHAYDSATVHAYGSATVHAYGSATVHATGRATVTQPHCYGSPNVKIRENAVRVDQRGDRPRCWRAKRGG